MTRRLFSLLAISAILLAACSGGAAATPALTDPKIILTDSIPLPPAKRISKIKTFSIAPLIGEAVRRIHRGESVGALFSSDVALTQQMLMWDDGTERTLDLSDDLPDDDDPAGDAPMGDQ